MQLLLSLEVVDRLARRRALQRQDRRIYLASNGSLFVFILIVVKLSMALRFVEAYFPISFC